MGDSAHNVQRGHTACLLIIHVMCSRYFAEVSQFEFQSIFLSCKTCIHIGTGLGWGDSAHNGKGCLAAAQYTAILTSSAAIHVITTCVPEYPNSLLLHTPFLGSSQSFFSILVCIWSKPL